MAVHSYRLATAITWESHTARSLHNSNTRQAGHLKSSAGENGELGSWTSGASAEELLTSLKSLDRSADATRSEARYAAYDAAEALQEPHARTWWRWDAWSRQRGWQGHWHRLWNR